MNLTFAQPAYFLLLLVLPVLVGLKLLADARGRALLRRAAAARLLPKLVERRTRWRDWMALALELAAIALLIAALARPQLGSVEEEILTSGRSVLLALDTSRSMLVEDLRPNRITRTKLVMSDLIAKLPTDRIGLIAFAGKPFLQAPVTQDHDALVETLDQCDTDIIPRGGSNLAEAIDLAIDAFKSQHLPAGKTLANLNAEEKALLEKSQATSQALIIFSDGEELEGTALAAAERARDASITIITVGVGTEKGGVIPNPDTEGRDYIRDPQGKMVISGLKKEILEQVASTTRGLYLPLDEVINDHRLDLILAKLDASTNKNKTLKKAVERYQWPLAASLLFMLAAIGVRVLRRLPGATLPMPATALVAFLLFIASSSAAVEISTPEVLESKLQGWQRRPSGEPDHLAWQRLGQGAVAYAKGDFDQAVERFGKALLGDDPSLRSQAHFNLANTFFQRAKISAAAVKKPDKKALTDLIRQLQDSLANYQSTLALNSHHAEAAANEKVVEELLKKLQEELEKQDSQPSKKDQQKKEGDKGDQGQQPGDPQQGQGKQDGKSEGQDGPPGDSSTPGQDKKEGDSSKESGDPSKEGQNGKEGDPSKEGEKEKEDARSEAQKEQEKAAQDASNQQRDGQAEAMKDGEQQGKKPSEGTIQEGEAKPNSKTGFSRNEARRNLDRFSDDVQVRPQFENARPDRPFKNW